METKITSKMSNEINSIKDAIDEIKLDQMKCQWGPWSEWGPCSQTCGNAGTKKRRRTLIIPALPGQQCQGSGDEVQQCNVHPCMKGTTGTYLLQLDY